MTMVQTPVQTCQLCADQGPMTTTKNGRVVCVDGVACLTRYNKGALVKKQEKKAKPSVCKDKVCQHGSVKHVGGPCIVFGCPCEGLK